MKPARTRPIVAVALAVLVAGCGSESAERRPAAGEFTTRIDNPYWPMAPGTKWVYREGNQRVTVTVTDRRKRVASGVEALVVRDTVTENGTLVEDTFDWFAQDAAGNVWYLGEDTKEYENGTFVSSEGSWEAGVDGAEAGIVMPAHPKPGMRYRQEYYRGHAEDAARVLSLDEQAQTAAGHFRGLLLTKDYTPLEPDVLEYKLYAKGVGPVLVLSPSGGGGREELVRHEPGVPE
jgi:hypothetical protein